MFLLTLLQIILQVALYTLSAGALLALWVRWLKRRYHQEDAAPAIFFARTRDNWRLALHRYRPEPGKARPHPPVVLCHGLAANRFQVDLDENGLARSLWKRGYDVWVLELRGAGLSRGPKTRPITFDDYVEEDLPAAISLVLQETGATRLHWIGFSTGAMAAYAYTSRVEEPPFASLVAIGAPTRFVDQPNLRRFTAVAGLLSFFGEVRLSFFTTLFAPLGGRMNPRIVHAIMNRENMEARTIRIGLANAVTNLSRDALRQYEDWVHNDQFRSIDHRVDYRRKLSDIRFPLLLIAGAKDIIAPPSAMEDLLREVASPRKALKIAGQKSGLSHDYGHVDLAYGRAVKEEIFPWLYEWLEEETPGTDSPASEEKRPASEAATPPAG